MSQTANKKISVKRSKVVKLPTKPDKKKKLVDPFGTILKREIDSRGVSIARMARDAGVNRSNVYKWIDGHVPGYADRLKVEKWMNGGEANTLQDQINQLHAENKAIIHQLAKLMTKGTTLSIADALASLKDDIELAKSDTK